MAKEQIFTLSELRANPKHIEKKFFEAMQDGYVSGRIPTQHKNKSFSHQTTEGMWRVTDRWNVGTLSCNNISGETKIFYDNTLIWVMQYFGSYAPEVIEFLKVTLYQNYKANIFLCGRGPERYSYEDLIYENKVAMGSSFRNFRGEEKIFHKTMLKGEHRYHGGLLI